MTTTVDGSGGAKWSHWTDDEESLLFDASLTYAEIGAMIGRSVGSIQVKVHYLRKRGVLIPARNPDAHSLMLQDADELFGHPIQENGGYWEPDGYAYRSCTRCGINMRLEIERERDVRAYCEGCNYPEFRAPFESGSAVEYLSVAA